MDRQEQIEVLLDHFNNPRGRKKLESADVVMPGGNPGCGDVVTMYLKVDNGIEPEQIGEISFVGSGCTISQAAASILMEMVNGDRPRLDDVLEMDYEDMVDALGRETVSSRPRCATLALGTLKAAVRKYQRDKLRREHGLPPGESPSEEEIEEFLI
ncbi:MAG TPA: iron-sulfur cluster assembly scaffold protein [Chloroflexota bacterium]|nr:iron-sulfur cluster assembly scaffold protein [Chloroflexota bacterium]